MAPEHPTVRRGRRTLVAALLTLGTIGCASGGVSVRTTTAPDANLSSDRTFRFLTPAVHDVAANPADDRNPMFENSITGREVRHDIARRLEERGYVNAHEGSTDLTIAYYIGAKNRLQVTNYDYGYPFWGWRGYRWGRGWGVGEREVTEWEEGTVIVDVLDGTGKRLLWRGVGKSQVPDDPQDYAKALNRSVSAIMSEFPDNAAPARK